MKKALLLFLLVVIGVAGYKLVPQMGGPSPIEGNDKDLYQLAEKLKPLHEKMGPVQDGDWLASHKEDGQTFREYVGSRHVSLTEDRNVLYVQPIGEFNEHQQKVIDLSAEFLGLYFACKVEVLETKSNDIIPAKARRVHSSRGVRQILSTYVLYDVLKPELSKDAVALIAFTSSDLYPADDWNFVYGQASLRERVGVWSIFRNGDAETEFETCLLRTLKTATHETGHMFSIQHCIAYECNMCGSNNRAESDRRPIQLCPECVTKVWEATNCDPVERFNNLADFFEKIRMTEQTKKYRDLSNAIQD